MALLPANVDQIVTKFGPHLARSQGRRLDAGVAPDGADDSILTPAALASIVCLLLNFGLLRYIYRLESR
jgi:hypothetical protein